MRLPSIDQGSDDLQQDAFKVVVLWIMEAQVALRDGNLEGLERSLSCLLILAYPLMKRDELAAVKRIRDDIRARLYAKPRPDIAVRNAVLVELEDLFEHVVTTLNVAGILYRARRDLNSIAAK